MFLPLSFPQALPLFLKSNRKNILRWRLTTTKNPTQNKTKSWMLFNNHLFSSSMFLFRGQSGALAIIPSYQIQKGLRCRSTLPKAELLLHSMAYPLKDPHVQEGSIAPGSGEDDLGPILPFGHHQLSLVTLWSENLIGASVERKIPSTSDSLHKASK